MLASVTTPSVINAEERLKVRLKSHSLILIFCFQPEEELPEQRLFSHICEKGLSHIKVCPE